MKLILASGSAARRQMLTNAGYAFEIIKADIDERQIQAAHLSSGKPAHDLAPALANAKARSVSSRYPADLVVGSDQVLICDGRVLNKVADLEQASAQLSVLQGKSHQLVSAVACWIGKEAVFEATESAGLSMYRLTSKEIEQYLRETGETILGSVGCYQIEGKGVRLFEAIEGSHFAIMGMPLLPLLGFLRQYKHLSGGKS